MTVRKCHGRTQTLYWGSTRTKSHYSFDSFNSDSYQPTASYKAAAKRYDAKLSDAIDPESVKYTFINVVRKNGKYEFIAKE